MFGVFRVLLMRLVVADLKERMSVRNEPDTGLPKDSACGVVSCFVPVFGESLNTMIPCTWLGITTNISKTVSEKCAGISSQHAFTRRPNSLLIISPLTTTPKIHSRW